MRVYTTHVGADLDGLAAMAAAPLLHGPGELVLDGPLQGAARRFLREHGEDLPPVRAPGDLDLSAVRELVVVDTRRRERIGALGAVAAAQGVRVVVYDHHPPAEDDLRADEVHQRPVGAVSTLVVEALAAAGVRPPPDRATLLLAGIHADTLGFTVPRTRADDHHAAARCLGWGADPDAAGRIRAERLTIPQVGVLDQVLADASPVETERGAVHVARASAEEFVEDAATAVEEAAAILHARALLVLLRCGGKIHVIGRGDGEVVDLGALLRELGGGGHPGAASAVVSGRPLPEVYRDLVLRLERPALSRVRTRDVMLHDPVTAGPDEPLDAVSERLNAFRVNALPVVAGGRLVGIITRQQVEGARHRGFGSGRVADWMDVAPATVDEDTPLDQLWRRSVEGTARVLCVVEGDRLVGLVTRTEVSRAVLGLAFRGMEGPGKERGGARDLAGRLAGSLQPRLAEALRTVGEAAAARGARAFLVGGAVRDLVMGRGGQDLDVAVADGAREVARAAAARLAVPLREHERFGTATLDLGEAGHLDVATARRETYRGPAALPDVEAGSLVLDLRRRDFTINAMAVELTPPRYGRLHDPAGGRRDVKDGVVRVLHHLSFVDDPTRAYRAARFAARFGFRVEKQTAHLLDAAVRLGLLERLSPQRRRAEFDRAVAEPDPVAVFARMEELGLLPSLGLGPLTSTVRDRLRRLPEGLALVRALTPAAEVETTLAVLLAWLHGGGDGDPGRVASCLGLLGRGKGVLLGWRERIGALRCRLDADSLPDSALHDSLEGVPFEAVAAALCLGEPDRAAQRVGRWLAVVRGTRRWVTGDDLRAHGVAPGPDLGRILADVFRRQLDGAFTGPAGALEAALATAGASPEPPRRGRPDPP